MRKAVLDVGSNSVLLLVEDKAGDVWSAVCEDTRVTSLGEGTKESGVLSEAAMQRTLAGMKELWDLALSHGATEIQAAATMAARIASNTPEFLARAFAQGTPVSVLSGEDEAELGFRAVANDPAFGDALRLSIVDVGGQSTEMVTADRHGDGWKVLFRRSYPIGTLALRGGLLKDECLTTPALLRAVKEIDDAIGLIYLPNQCGEVVTLGATGTNLITIREQMTAWDPARVHGAYLDYEEVSKAVGWMSRMTDAERAAIVGMERGREKTLHLGALILERALHAFRALGTRVSVRGWRHALLESP
ncbi:MAG: exopolyphosphatase / guanosine-5-triphosphate,3-diphosphate pyrophosphatase [Fimbriimonadaceae bacterium]|jgi:exopolyphosphatase/guanosine-5'-triphosphate,3'-diphosphate pyrophosphatase|nr:exopolyphosphatase / guanosine-5-triphosphate,3-diphosphate pyrophosphatase [Fimbriimonadaceae bacterium]